MSLVERDKRMALNLPVEVRGEDVAGVPFTEHTAPSTSAAAGSASRAIGRSGRSPPAPRDRAARHAARHFGNKDVYRAAPWSAGWSVSKRGGARIGARFLREEAPRDGMMLRFAPHG